MLYNNTHYWSVTFPPYSDLCLHAMSLQEIINHPSNDTHCSSQQLLQSPLLTKPHCCCSEGSKRSSDPFTFYIRLNSRHDRGEWIPCNAALQELQDIIHFWQWFDKSSNRHLAWWRWDPWKRPSQLNAHLRELLENIKYCWLGSFMWGSFTQPYCNPAIVDSPSNSSETILGAGQEAYESSISHIPSQLKLDDTHSASCHLNFDEELASSISFLIISCLWLFPGSHWSSLFGRMRNQATQTEEGSKSSLRSRQTLVILDKNIRVIPWETLPILTWYTITLMPVFLLSVNPIHVFERNLGAFQRTAWHVLRMYSYLGRSPTKDDDR